MGGLPESGLMPRPLLVPAAGVLPGSLRAYGSVCRAILERIGLPHILCYLKIVNRGTCLMVLSGQRSHLTGSPIHCFFVFSLFAIRAAAVIGAGAGKKQPR